MSPEKPSSFNPFNPTILMAVGLMSIIVMMILPVPSWILDIGLAASFALAILVFTVTLFIEEPLDFSSFPTVLLASLMLRLSLNVSSTKLIIGQGYKGSSAAGEVIEGFALFIMGGNVFVGLVVFCVLLIVNFMVITKGATRMAEVGARFALDGMPGKQLAIDSDVSSGAIDHDEARRRRESEQAEATFFGSLDGASKFVKGDAVAGLLITVLNLLVGLIMGLAVHHVPLDRALETYTILTVGDGLVSQIPAVIISVASALLLARGGEKGATDLAVLGQLRRHPAALGTVGAVMLAFSLVPGFPFAPFFFGAIALFSASYFGGRRPQTADRVPSDDAAATDSPSLERSIGDVLDLDDIHLEFAPDLVAMALDSATGIDTRITNMRKHVAATFGLILPEVRLTDNHALPQGTYVIRIQGVEQVRDVLRPEGLLALSGSGEVDLPDGDDVKEPVYGAPARWISRADRETAALAGTTIVTPTEVLATHLLEVIKRNFPRLMTLKALRRLLNELTNLSDPARSEANRKLIDELVPDRVPVDLLLSILRLLLEERVSIRNMPLILEATSEARSSLKAPEAICEHVRQRLGFQIVSEFRRSDGTLPLLQLAPEWEDTFATYQIESPGGFDDIALPPEAFGRLANGLAERLNKASGEGVFPAIVTSTRRRRFLSNVLSAKQINAPVLSYEEIGLEAKPSMVGVVPV